MKIINTLIAVLFICGASQANAYDFKKELKKVIETEKKKYEDQQKKDKENKAPPAAAPAQLAPPSQPAPAPAPAPAPTVAPAADVVIAPPPVDFEKMKPDERIRYAWKNLPSARDACNDFIKGPFPKNINDYSGTTTACRLSSLLDQKYLEKISGFPAFVQAGADSKGVKPTAHLFSHYNKKFVEWAIKNAIPGATDRAFKMATQQIYKDYLATSAESFLRTIYMLEAYPKQFAQMQKKYVDAMSAPGGIMGVGSFISRLIHEFPIDPGPGPTVSFWLRRSIDGSASALKAGLEALIRTYTPERVGALRVVPTKK